MNQKTLSIGIKVISLSLFLSLVQASFVSVSARAGSGLIYEVEQLRNSLSVRDPSRSALTLRLADLVFNETVELGRNPAPTDSQVSLLEKRRKDAIALYREILTGLGGMFPKASGSQKTKVEFQLARLYSDQGDLATAHTFWVPLSEQTQLIEIQREATLRLAERSENAGQFKESENYYDRVLQLCQGTDICSFAHYRKGWIYYRQNLMVSAKSEMKLALFDSRGKARDESVRDYVLFNGKSEPDAQSLNAILIEFDALSEKLVNPSLLNELADSFYAAGNKNAGTYILAEANRKRPEIKHQARLLEEYYGQRNWEEFRNLLSKTIAAAQPIADMKQIASIEAEKILRRLTVQFDGERITQPVALDDFKTLVFLYLKLIPFNEHRVKMQDGWLAAETNLEVKMNQLSAWTLEEKSKESGSRLREIRATLAQKASRLEIVIEEMKVLVEMYPEQRKFRYHLARALYELKHYDLALPYFQQLAQPVKGQLLGDALFAVESEHQALDILGRQKKFTDVVTQSLQWTHSENLGSKARAEKPELLKIAQSAQFEWAVSQGETQAALDQFKKFCVERPSEQSKESSFAEKSCENAKILSVKLKDQSALLSVLSQQGPTIEYASELEAAGYFKSAAEMRDKLIQLGKQSDSIGFSLKTAVFFELDNDFASRDRILKRVAQQAFKAKHIESEDLLFASLLDAKLMKTEHIKAPWTETHRLRIAALMEEQGQGTSGTRAILLSSLQSAGSAWAKYVTLETDRLNADQAKISIHGKNGQRRFEQRLIALKKLASWVDRYASGSDFTTRIRLLDAVSSAHQKLAEEVLSSPLPEGLAPEAVAQIQASLKELANPISEKAAAYKQMLAEQKEKSIQDDSLKLQQSAAVSSPLELSAGRAALAKDPSDRLALSKIHTYYINKKQSRLAAYFQGRILGLR